VRSMRAVSCLLLLWVCAACAPEPEASSVLSCRSMGNAFRRIHDRHIFIDRGRIGFGTSALAADGYVITKIDESREGGKTLFVVSYQDAEQAKFQLAFFYEPAGWRTDHLKNQDHLTWTRKAATT
jgi:hypothetical protein